MQIQKLSCKFNVKVKEPTSKKLSCKYENRVLPGFGVPWGGSSYSFSVAYTPNKTNSYFKSFSVSILEENITYTRYIYKDI